MMPFSHLSQQNGVTAAHRVKVPASSSSLASTDRLSRGIRKPSDVPYTGIRNGHSLSESSPALFSLPGLPSNPSMQSNLVTHISGVLQEERSRNGPAAPAVLTDRSSLLQKGDVVRGMLLKLNSAASAATDVNSLLTVASPTASAIANMEPESPDDAMAASLLRQLVAIDQRQQLLKQLLSGCLSPPNQGVALLNHCPPASDQAAIIGNLGFTSISAALDAERQRMLIETLIARSLSYQASQTALPLDGWDHSGTVANGASSTMGYTNDRVRGNPPHQMSLLEDSSKQRSHISPSGTVNSNKCTGKNQSSAASSLTSNFHEDEEPQYARDVPTPKIFPSERASLDIIKDCDSPSHVGKVLKFLGSTLRSKADPFIDVTTLPTPPVIEDKRVVRGTDVFFPDTLYRMLEDAEREGLDDVIQFLPHGRAFRVSNKGRFVEEILPLYFSEQTKWSSFSRQLRLYGFLRVSKGIDFDAYYHELFLKGKKDLVRYMRRVGAPHGLDRRTYKLAEADDPDFYKFPQLKSSDPETPKTSSEKPDETEDFACLPDGAIVGVGC